MIIFPENAAIFLHGTPIDLRNGFDGLSFLVHTHFEDKMKSNTHFVFVNSRRTRMKILSYCKNNLSIFYIRLRKGVFFPPCVLHSKKINLDDFYNLINKQAPEHLFRPQNII
jgi:transposase